MDYLNSILERKRADLKKILPLEGKLRASAIQRNDYAGFRTAVDLGENRLSVVPEMSRVHPVLNLRESNQDLRHLYGDGNALRAALDEHAVQVAEVLV